MIDRSALKDARRGTASENCNATNSLNMKKQSPSKTSIITILWLILAFIGLSSSSLWADTVYVGIGSAFGTTGTGCSVSTGTSTTGGYSGTTSYASSAPGNLAICVAGGKYNNGGQVVDGVPWVQLAPTLAGCGGTYIVYGTRGSGFSSDSPDASFGITYVNCSSATTSTGFFHAGGWTPNDWKAICTITLSPGQTAPTVTFTYHSGSLGGTYRIGVNGFKFDQVVDGTGTANCGSITSPVLDSDGTIHVHGCSASATAIIIKDTSNGNAVLGETDFSCDGSTPADVDVTVNLTGLANHILKAVQTIAGVTSRLSVAPSVTVTASATAPDLTSITTPVYSDAATVTVNGVDPTGNEVKIYDITASTVIADQTFAAGPSSEAIPVVAGLLVQGHVIKATQFVGGNESALATAPQATVAGPICTSVPNVTSLAAVYDNATTVTVNGCKTTAPAATTINVYRSGILIGSASGGSATVVVTVNAPSLPLVAGQVLKATQVVSSQESCLSSAPSVTVQPICASVANVGGFTGPLDGGASTITVSGCSVSASLIKVYQGASVVGTAAGGAAIVAVPCTGLTKGSTLKATQVVGTQESCLSSAPSSGTIGSGAPKKVRFCIGLRNTTGATAPLGTDGGGTGTIYFLGASAGQFGQYVGPTGIPAKNIVTADSGWHTLSFNVGDPSWNGSSNVAGSPVGNAGAGGSSWATLEGLYIVPDDPTDTGEYRIYIDNIVNGSQGVLQDFETAAAGTVGVTFSNPSASGTTGGSLLGTPTPTPNTTVVTAALADTGAQSEVVDFQFKETNAGNWLRLNTLNSAVQKNPSVDITQPITIRVRLYSPTVSVSPIDTTHLQFIWDSTWGMVKRGSLTSGSWTAVTGTSPLTLPISQADPPTFFRLQAP